MAGDGVEILRDRAPQTPVRRAEVGDARAVERVAVGGADVVAGQQRDCVADVLLVQLDDLQLREQQLGQRDAQAIDLEPALERNLVRHAKGPDEHIDVASMLLVEEEQPLLRVQGVERDVRLVTQPA